MTLSDIRELVLLKLGDQSRFYGAAEIDRSGVNPAQRLLCLYYPALLRQRATLTVNADVPFIDARTLQDAGGNTIGNRLRTIRRVVLGNVMADAPVRNAATDELKELRPITVPALISRTRDWLKDKGRVDYYWTYGPYWLGLYKRPLGETTVTVVFDAAPAPLLQDSDVPQVQEAYHRVIADIAAGILMTKEGEPQGTLGVNKVQAALGSVPRRQERSA
jgi:hypothetical protein